MSQHHTCTHEGCDREFIDAALLAEHAETVHTFDEIRTAVSEKIRETYGRRGDYTALPKVSPIWTWVRDVSSDWVVFTIEAENTEKLYKASYTIADNVVTLGEPAEVVQRTVYEPVTTQES